MAYFPDLSFYEYFRGDHPVAKNIGWLQRGHEFATETPSEEALNLLWSFCSISVMQTRGVHECDLCEVPQAVYAVRNGTRLLLGTSEIRVFSRTSTANSLVKAISNIESSGLIFLRRSELPISIYAVPSLIYHYVQAHHYKPPPEFLDALKEGLKPPEQQYFDRLESLGIDWKLKQSVPAERP
jgi:hypothetical protein